MWLILLDRSTSMGDPFSGPPPGSPGFAGRTRSSDAATKLDAAKQAVAEHLAGLGSPTRVVLVAFNTVAQVVYDGPSDRADAVAAVLAAVLPGGGTNVAAALRRATELVRAAPAERSFRTLLVTDGKSELEAARGAALALADAGAVIDAVLIDPTAEGQALARAVTLNGAVSAVASVAQLQQRVSQARAAQEAEQSAIDALDRQVAGDRARLAAERPMDERLAFTATYPTVVQPQRWYPFTVFMHLAALQAEVARQIQAQVQAGIAVPFVSSSAATRGVTRGTLLTFTPVVQGLEFNPPTATVAWYEDIQDLRLRLRAPADMQGRSAHGYVEVAVDSLPIAQLGVAINVQPEGSALDPAPQTAVQPAQQYQDVFASYASTDAAVVHACRAAYWALGIHLVVDKQTLRSGQAWSPGLRALIDRCDLFQLFWSGNAALSGPVAEEYRHALARLPDKGEGFVRLTAWEQPPPPLPEPLRRYHFAPLDLAALARATGLPLAAGAGAAPAAESAAAAAAAGTPIPAAVVPLLPGAAPDQAHAVRADVSAAVHFLESVTGLRYYPVPTLLVDEHVVKTVRAEHTVDLPPADPAWGHEVSALGGFLHLCALWFHVGGFMAERVSWSDAGSHFGVGTLITAEQYSRLRSACEVPPDVEAVAAPAWRQAQHRLGLRLGQPGLDLGLAAFLHLLLAQVAAEIGRIDAPQAEVAQSAWGGDRRPLAPALEAAFVAAGGEVGNVKRSTALWLYGPRAAFVALMQGLAQAVVGPAQALDDHDPSRGDPPPAEAAALDGLCGLASLVANQLLDFRHPLYDLTEGFGFGNWVDQLANPRWRGFAGTLVQLGLAPAAAQQSLAATVQALGTALQPMLDLQLRAGDASADCGCPLPATHWQRLAPGLQALGLSATPTSTQQRWGRDTQEVTLSGPVAGFVEGFRRTITDLVALLQRVPARRGGRARVFVEQTPTFGIFAPAASTATDAALSRWAAGQGVAQALTLPGTDRVLFCLGALQRQRQALASTAAPGAVPAASPDDAAWLAAQFQRCVLVHEHFHALAAVGLGDSPRARAGLGGARGLNESLAAWMELHWVRGDAAMTRLVQAYIGAGEYPAWPYAGARWIEREFGERGIAAIRDWVARLRALPDRAQANFDRLCALPLEAPPAPAGQP